MPYDGRCSNILHMAWNYCHIIFGPLKAIRGHMLMLDENGQEATLQCLAATPRNYLWMGYTDVIHQWDSYLNACDDFSQLL